jgi:hypothetical protein
MKWIFVSYNSVFLGGIWALYIIRLSRNNFPLINAYQLVNIKTLVKDAFFFTMNYFLLPYLAFLKQSYLLQQSKIMFVSRPWLNYWVEGIDFLLQKLEVIFSFYPSVFWFFITNAFFYLNIIFKNFSAAWTFTFSIFLKSRIRNFQYRSNPNKPFKSFVDKNFTSSPPGHWSSNLALPVESNQHIFWVRGFSENLIHFANIMC